jgi:hypothetical protein
MYMWSDEDHNRFKPTEEDLEKCEQVLITDPAFRMWQMRKWCRENDLSLVWSELVGTEDVSGCPYDEIAAFWFIDPRDATAFTLKFK